MTILRDAHNNLMIESRFAERNITRLKCVRPKCVHNQNGACSFNGMIEIGVKCKTYTETKPIPVMPEDYEDPKCSSGVRCFVTAYFFGKTQEEVVEKKIKYRKKYPPQGYGTYDSSHAMLMDSGFWFGTVCRYSTCD